MKKNILSIIVVVIIVSLIATPSVFARADFLKSSATEAANIFRNMGFSEDSAAVRLCQLAYLQTEGKVTDGSYLYDSTTGKKYYLGQPNSNIYGSTPYSSYSTGTYWFDNHEWYYDNYRQKYYRFDENGNKKWLDTSSTSSTSTTQYYGQVRTGNGQIGASTSNTNSYYTANAYTLAENISGYNYYAGKIPLYGGRIYGLAGLDETEVKMLAKLTNSYADGQDLLRKTAFMWSVLDVKGNSNLATIVQKYYPGYDDNAWSDWDLEELAREVIFRKNLEDSGSEYVGRTLPKGYGYINSTTYSNGYHEISFSQIQNGTPYTFPDAWSTYRSRYHSPY